MRALVLALAFPLLVACSGSSAIPVDFDPVAMPASADSLGAEAYVEHRAAFLADMRDLRAEQSRAARSVAGRVKRVIAFGGLAVGLGGTVASFVVEDEDTRATIGQAGGTVASISGILGLLPIGDPPRGAAAIERYLDGALARFEARWPAGAGPLGPGDTRALRADMVEMEATVRSLAP